ncbi:MAG TPA: hypothetical protein VH257_19150, partial [Chloroflexota bacterium]|nr:hypothetical protein [Chloroflexota bacterium]
VPQWYAVPVGLSLLREGRVTVEVAPEAAPEARPGEAWLRVWGDYPLRERVYEGPAVHSRILGADNAFHKLVATGHPMLWRRAPLSGGRGEGARGAGGTWSGGDLSEAPGRQSGEYRIRLLVLAPNGDLLALY